MTYEFAYTLKARVYIEADSKEAAERYFYHLNDYELAENISLEKIDHITCLENLGK